MAADREIAYQPAGPIIRDFHRSDAFVRGVMGPYGSGKSTACVLELLRRAQMQAPSADGVRRSRFAIIRNSFPELKSTTLKTWKEWVPLRYGKFTMDSPIVHHITADGLDAEFLFMALDKEEDARKLLSLELTGAWINEARTVPKAILDALTGRVGRYPAASAGGCSWSGVLLDTNPPDTESWWYKLAEAETPKDWKFFKQPSGLAAEAENLDWLNQTPETLRLPIGHAGRRAQGRRYYERQIGGKDPDWVKVYVHGEYGFVTEGQAVYPSYRDQVHCAGEEIEVPFGEPLMLGADFGLTPAAVFGWRAADGRWMIVDELVMTDVGVIRFAEQLSAYVAKEWPNNPVRVGYGDPAGNQRASTDERTALDILRKHTEWKWLPAPSNDPTMRLEVVKAALNRMVDGRPGLLISSKCPVLRKGFAGGYHRKFVKTTGSEQLHEQPAKTQYSHPHDALQYLLLGGGEAGVVLNKVQSRQRGSGPRMARDVDYPLFG